MAFARSSLAVLLAGASVAGGAAFTLGTAPAGARASPELARAPARPVPAAVEEPAAGPSAGVAAAVAAAMVGLLVGLTSGPQAASAVPRGLPSFSLSRPSYMQGVDAANAATRPGEIDYVTRSRIEALQWPEARKEAEMVRAKEQARPSKAERVARAKQQLQQLLATTEIPA
uniref:PSI-F n=1 Tax=Zooxanthella nutricula TaxID=1333877 RepID=A0A6U9TR73_9DINO